jgi:acetyl esterase/lipase
MNPLFKAVIKLASSPRIDMQEDYVWVRKIQDFFSRTSSADYQFLDAKIYAKNEEHEIPVRIFIPDKIKYPNDHIIYMHGGGWTLGNIDTYTSACVNLANQLNRIVYSIDYRKAPEHPYPAGFNDCLQVVESLQKMYEDDVDRNWILMGDSAGGNLAAAVSLKLAAQGKTRPKKQVLIYPLTYWDHSVASPFESIQTNGYDYGLTIKKITEYMEMYVPDENMRKTPYVAPLMADDLSGQPDTLVITAEFDPLRDEGEAYGEALKKAGNRAEVHCIPDSVHGFITYPRFLAPLVETYKHINSFLADE